MLETELEFSQLGGGAGESKAAPKRKAGKKAAAKPAAKGAGRGARKAAAPVRTARGGAAKKKKRAR